MPVSPPYDILELRAEGELITRVTSFEEGPVPVTPREGRPPKVVQATRLYVPPEDKQTAPDYWDITAQSLKPNLRAILLIAVQTKRYIRLHKYGDGPGARFSVSLEGADYTGGPRADTKNMAGP